MARKLTIRASDDQRTPPKRDDPRWEEWLEQQYREQAAEEAADPELAAEIREWLEADLGDTLPDAWDEWSRLYAEWKLNNPSE